MCLPDVFGTLAWYANNGSGTFTKNVLATDIVGPYVRIGDLNATVATTSSRGRRRNNDLLFSTTPNRWFCFETNPLFKLHKAWGNSSK